MEQSITTKMLNQELWALIISIIFLGTMLTCACVGHYGLMRRNIAPREQLVEENTQDVPVHQDTRITVW